MAHATTATKPRSTMDRATPEGTAAMESAAGTHSATAMESAGMASATSTHMGSTAAMTAAGPRRGSGECRCRHQCHEQKGNGPRFE
jgi:hypothetical protein